MSSFSPALPHGARALRLHGFTLIELMVALAIAGTLTALAVPGLQNLMAGRAVAARTGELVDGLHFARSEAMKRGAPVTLCKTINTPAPACSDAAADDWRGWMVFADYDNDGRWKPGEPVLRVQAGMAGAVGAVAHLPATTPTALRFQSTGIMIPSPPASQVRIVIHPDLPLAGTGYLHAVRQICVNTQGRAVSIDGLGNCP